MQCNAYLMQRMFLKFTRNRVTTIEMCNFWWFILITGAANELAFRGVKCK